MKKFLVVSLVSFFWCSAFGQRHIHGENGVELLGGISKYGQTSNGGYVHFFSRKIYSKANVFFAQDSDQGLKHSSLGLDLTCLYSIPLYRNIVYGSLKGGLAFANDRITSEVPNDFPTMKMGVVGGVELESYLSNKFSLVLDADERYYSGSLYGSNRYYVRFGFRVHFLK